MGHAPLFVGVHASLLGVTCLGFGCSVKLCLFLRGQWSRGRGGRITRQKRCMLRLFISGFISNICIILFEIYLFILKKNSLYYFFHIISLINFIFILSCINRRPRRAGGWDVVVPYSVLDQLGVDGALPVDVDLVVWEHGEGAHPWLMTCQSAGPWRGSRAWLLSLQPKLTKMCLINSRLVFLSWPRFAKRSNTLLSLTRGWFP